MTERGATVTMWGVFCSAIGIGLIALKLLGLCSWSWWWVTCLIWFPWCVIVLGIVGVIGWIGVASFYTAARDAQGRARRG